MTKISGVADTDNVVPGMSFFSGTGPDGTTCGGCKHRGYYRQSSRGHWNEAMKTLITHTYRVTKCAMFNRMTGHHGANIDADTPSCKYYEKKPT
jgi:hypothetical protein